jgi:hypothetical protein
MSISISQGDYILYQDISEGSPTGRIWNFPGGTPTGATATNPIVRYASPSNTGFSAKLTVSIGSISSSNEKSNIIVVAPENISMTMTSNQTAVVSMGKGVTYTAVGSTASAAYYTWNVAGLGTPGITTANNQLGAIIYNWLTLTGSESGATYSTYVSTSSVILTSLLGNTASSSVTVAYSKNGLFERYNYLASPFTLGLHYQSVADTGILLTALGISGSGNAYSVNTTGSSAVPIPINNTQFRAQGEITSYWSSSQDIVMPSSINYGLFTGQYIASSLAFNALGVPGATGWGSLTRYTLGNYMLPGDLGTYFSNIFYFADIQGYGKSLINNRYWTSTQVSNLIFNEFSIGYQSSKALEVAFYSGEYPVAYAAELDGAGGASGGYGGACLPAASFVGGSDVKLYLTLRFSTISPCINNIESGYDMIVEVVVSSMSINAGLGNSPDGTLVFMQDTGAGSGVASLINAALVSNGNLFENNVVASASPDYAWMYNIPSGVDPNTFNGLKISIIDNDWLGSGLFIAAVDLSDNGPWAPYTFWPGVPVAGNPGKTNWISFNTNRIANPYQIANLGSTGPVRGWYFGQSII